MKFHFLAAALVAASPALAQSSLGFSGADLRVGSDFGEGGGAVASGRLDVAVTEFHGLQFDLGLEETGSGTLGTAATHLYMTPRDGQKYGVFAIVGDVDDRSATYGAVGGEAIFSLSDVSAVELRAGAGLASHSDLDFIFAEADIYYDISPEVTLRAGATLTEFDEIGLSATGYEARIGVDYSPAGAPWGLYAEVARDGLSGHASDPETSFRAGLTVELGNTQRGGPETRPYRTPDPIRPLLRRGLF